MAARINARSAKFAVASVPITSRIDFTSGVSPMPSMPLSMAACLLGSVGSGKKALPVSLSMPLKRPVTSACSSVMTPTIPAIMRARDGGGVSDALNFANSSARERSSPSASPSAILAASARSRASVRRRT
jgi:hypothetical protein